MVMIQMYTIGFVIDSRGVFCQLEALRTGCNFPGIPVRYPDEHKLALLLSRFDVLTSGVPVVTDMSVPVEQAPQRHLFNRIEAKFVWLFYSSFVAI